MTFESTLFRGWRCAHGFCRSCEGQADEVGGLPRTVQGGLNRPTRALLPPVAVRTGCPTGIWTPAERDTVQTLMLFILKVYMADKKRQRKTRECRLAGLVSAQRRQVKLPQPNI